MQRFARSISCHVSATAITVLPLLFAVWGLMPYIYIYIYIYKGDGTNLAIIKSTITMAVETQAELIVYTIPYNNMLSFHTAFVSKSLVMGDCPLIIASAVFEALYYYC